MTQNTASQENKSGLTGSQSEDLKTGSFDPVLASRQNVKDDPKTGEDFSEWDKLFSLPSYDECTKTTELTPSQLERFAKEASRDYAKLIIDTSSEVSRASSRPVSPMERVKKALEEKTDKVVFMSQDLRELMTILASTPSCLSCRAACEIIERSLLKTADIPMRDDSWFDTHICDEIQHTDECSAFKLVDWDYHEVGRKPSPNFLRNLRNVVTGSCFVYDICDSKSNIISKKERKAALQKVRGNPYVIYLGRMLDAEICPLEGNAEFFSKIYRIRSRCGLNGDYGYKLRYTAQNDDESEQAADEGTQSWTENMPQFRAKFNEIVGKIIAGSKDWARYIVDAFFQCIGSVMGVLGSALKSVTQALKNMAIDMIQRVFGLDKFVQYIHSHDFKMKAAVTCACLISMLIMVVIGVDWWITDRITRAIRTGIINAGYPEVKHVTFWDSLPNTSVTNRWTRNAQVLESRRKDKVQRDIMERVNANTHLFAQGRVDPVQAAVTMGCLFWNLKGDKTSFITHKARVAMDMMKLGTVVSCVTTSVFALMPVVIKECVLTVVESPTDRLKRESYEWCTTTQELMKLQQVPAVMASDHFYQRLRDEEQVGNAIFQKLRGPDFSDVRAYHMGTLVRVYQLNTILVSMKNETRKRREPMSFHICGKGGVGKSLVLESLLLSGLNIEPEEIYSKNCGENFFSGYHGQKVVVMDEFCVGSVETKEVVLRQYLNLNSSAQYRLEMASLNDPRVGIKGTCFDSEFVITMNNTAYDRLPGFDEYTIWRRRRFVAEFSFKPNGDPDVRTDENGKLDFTRYTVEEIRRAVWLRIRILPRTPVTGWESISAYMNYDAFVDFVREQHLKHREEQDLVEAALGATFSEKINPKAMIDNIFRRASGVPEIGKSFFANVTDWMFGTDDDEEPDLEAQSKPRHNHTCPTCGTKRRHVVDITGKYTCERCDEESICNENGERPQTNERSSVDEIYATEPHDDLPGALRIGCLFENCDKQKAVRTGEEPEPFLCADHIRFDRPANVIELNRIKQGKELRPEKVHDDLDSWRKAVIEDMSDVSYVIYRDYFTSTAKAFFNIYRPWLPWMGAFKLATFGLVIVSALALRKIRKMSDEFEDEPDITFDAQANYDRSTRTHKPKGTLFKSKPQRGKVLGAQNLTSVEPVHVTINDKNILAVPICEKYLLTFYHAISDHNGQIAEGPYPMTVQRGGTIYQGVYTADNVVALPERDLCVIEFDDPKMPKFKDVRKRFIDRDDVDVLEGKCLVKVDVPGKEMYGNSRLGFASYSAFNRAYELPKALHYNTFTRNGDCGAPVLVASGPLVKTIVGIHVAGTGNVNNPQGCCSIVTQQDLFDMTAVFREQYYPTKSIHSELEAQNMDTIEHYLNGIEKGEYPNLVSVEKLPLNQRIHCCEKTKLKPSAIAEHLPWKPQKGPAVLSQQDLRSDGKDPFDLALKKLAKVPENTSISDEEITRVVEDMFVKYDAIIEESVYATGPYTLETAVGGLPGVLKSMDTSTAAGYPLGLTVKQGGKRSLVKHIDGECHLHPDFKRMCDDLEAEMDNYNGDPSTIDYFFQGFGKDELRSVRKLEKVDTRITYANDFRFNAIVRKYLGPAFVAISKSFGQHGFAISLNPQSFDMDKIYRYLREVDPESEELLVNDGDFEGFDIHHPQKVMIAIFKLIFRLLERFKRNKRFWNYVLDHEMRKGASIKDIRFVFKHILCSGSLFTTLFNCMINEFYFRTLFARDFPYANFEEWIRIVILGDDHQIACAPRCGWTPKKIGEGFAKMGLKYTSARKGEELGERKTPFYASLFLGSVPQRHHGAWSGALRKETLMESLLWTRNNNLTMDAEVRQMIEAASQWDKDFWLWYVKQLRRAYQSIGRPFPEVPGSWEGLGRSVAERTTDSGFDFPLYRAQGDNAVDAPSSSAHVDGLTTLKTDTVARSKEASKVDRSLLANKSLLERSADLSFGANSLMKRYTATWSSADTIGTTLITNSVPFGLLGLGDQQNLQNMAFQNFLYCTTNVRIVFQVNGTPTQAGLLIAYYVPLLNFTPDRYSKPSFDHCWMTPNKNTTSELNIDFNYWRSCLNTNNAAYFPEVMGYVKVDVTAVLTSLAATTCDITMYVAFDADFKIPRPIPVPPVDGTVPKFGLSKNSTGTINIASGLYVGQGSNVSTTSVNNTYTIGDIGGNMPVQADVEGGKTSWEGKADIKVPMDNPPLAGGAVPIVGQFSSMSKSNGVEVTTAMQLHQAEMHYEPIMTRNPLDSNIQEICGKLGQFDSPTWSTAQVAGTEIVSIHLDSFLGLQNAPPAVAVTKMVPANMCCLNQFTFARYDIVIEVCAVKTNFHSGRLLASVAYGDNSVNLNELNVYMNNVLDFNGENCWQSFRINYNNSQEYIRTWNGPGVARDRDYSLGTLKLSVLNDLRATSEVVSNVIDLLLFVRFENVRVAVPKPNPLVHWASGSNIYMAQGDNILSDTPDAPDEESATVVDTTAVTFSPPPTRPCKVTFGEKFDYTITDVHELVRRHIPLPFNGAPTSKTANAGSNGVRLYTGAVNSYDGTAYDVYRFFVTPWSDWNYLFAGWSGHIKFRIFVYDAKPALCWYVPYDFVTLGVTDNADVTLGGASTRIATGVGTDVFHSPAWMPNVAREMTYPYTSGCSMIDVSVPFTTQYNFLPTFTRMSEVPDSTAAWHNGWLYVRVAQGAKLEVFQAMGDDFRYHVYCPDVGIRVRGTGLSKVGATTTTFATGDRVASYYV